VKKAILAAALLFCATAAQAADGPVGLMPPGAQDVKGNPPAFTMFRVATKAADVEKFYTAALAKQGYTPIHATVRNTNHTTLMFGKTGETGSVVLTDKGASTNVMLTLTKK
jgi:hypothetical protein